MAAQPGATNKAQKAIIVFVAAQLFIAVLIWLVFSGSDEREGRIKATLAADKAKDAQSAVASYYEERKILPSDNNALQLQNKQGQPYFTAFEEQGNPSYTVAVADGVITLTFSKDQEPVSGKTLVFAPRISDGKLNWSCNTGSLEAKFLPLQCGG